MIWKFHLENFVGRLGEISKKKVPLLVFTQHTRTYITGKTLNEINLENIPHELHLHETLTKKLEDNITNPYRMTNCHFAVLRPNRKLKIIISSRGNHEIRKIIQE